MCSATSFHFFTKDVGKKDIQPFSKNEWRLRCTCGKEAKSGKANAAEGGARVDRGCNCMRCCSGQKGRKRDAGGADGSGSRKYVLEGRSEQWYERCRDFQRLTRSCRVEQWTVCARDDQWTRECSG